MKIDEYITHLRSKNILITVKEDNIAIDAPDEVITNEIIEELKAKKPAILDFFNSMKRRKRVFSSIPSIPESKYYPLSSAQKRMYFLYEFDKGGTNYNLPGFYRIGGKLNVTRLESAFKALIARHQSLRTVFKLVEGVPVQQVLDVDSFEMVHHSGDASGIDTLIADFVRPFDLSKEIPARVSLIEVTGEDYLLMIDMHHIINDGVSQEILMREFLSLYHGDTLPELRIQYKDYASWQQSEDHQALVSTHKSYWLEMYSEEVTALNLPIDYPRSLHRSNQDRVFATSFDKSQSDRLRTLASSEGVTMYTLFLAIYNVLLSKLSNQQDIIVGAPTAGRHHADLEGMVGMFVNTLALRNNVYPDRTFKDFLACVQDSTLSAFDHQLFQYEELVEALNLPRDVGRNPLFDVFFSYNQQKQGDDFNDSDITIKSQDIAYNIAKFDLSLAVQDAEEISLSFEYRTDLFEASTIARFMAYLERIIEEVLEDDARQLGDIEILSKEEHQILEEFNSTSVDYEIERTVLDLFDEQVRTCSNKAAVIYDGVQITYKELDSRSTQWAMNLASSGIVPGSVVGLRMTRSIEMVTAIFSVMKTGAAYMVLDPELPDSRMIDMMEGSGGGCIITNIEEQLAGLSPYPWIGVEELEHGNEFQGKINLPDVSPESLAYILYTSGSTGKPKGCMISHSNLFNYIFWSNAYYFGGSQEGNWGLMTPMSFDLSVTAIFTSLTRGKELYLCDERKGIDQLLEDCFTNPAIDILKLTPTHISILKDLEIKDTTIKAVICGGEKLKKIHIEILKGISEEIKVYNEYGPTETTVGCTVAEVTTDKISIGGPIANTKIHILDERGKVVPPGVIGEMYIGGSGVSQGYVNNTVLTSERFVSVCGSVCYKTGDLGRWDSEGDIEYIGRADDQIKIRGFRVELGEIESVLENHSSVEQAFVTDYGAEENKQLVAYICGSGELEGSEIRSVLATKLPNYMIPTSYIWLDSFPLTSNGKVDRRALPSPDLTKDEVYVAPENELQEQLISIWSEVLGIEKSKISITSDFFNLGGHSLLALRLKHLINRNLKVELSLFEIFLTPTISLLAKKIDAWEVNEKEETIIVPINNNYQAEKLFVIHDGSGEVDGYLELTRKIHNYKCYGIKFDQFNAIAEAPDIREISLMYINEIKSIQPKGPYHLLGWSLGGEIATEMTSQLESVGEKVENLVVVDTSFKYKKPSEKILFDIESELQLMKLKFGFSPENKKDLHFINDIWLQFSKSEIFRKLSIDDARSVIPQEIAQLIPDFLTKTNKELFEAANKIRLLIASSENHFLNRAVEARTLYIRPTQSGAIQNREKLARYFTNLTLQDMSGDHFSVMKNPRVVELATIVNDHLTSKPGENKLQWIRERSA